MMRITLDSVGIGSGLGAALSRTDLWIDGSLGVPVAIAVETDERPLLLSLLLGGRLKHDTGRLIVGDSDAGADVLLRAGVALVDTPFVAEPSAGIRLSTVVAEELTFAGLPSSTRAVRQLLERLGVPEYERLAMRALPPVDRIRLFSELATLRPGVEAIVITSPERHGAAAADWYPHLIELVDRSITVIVVTDAATAGQLVALGAADAAVRPPEPEPPTPPIEPESPGAESPNEDPSAGES